MYGFDYKKPTTIYSNYNLSLRTCNHNYHKETIGTVRVKHNSTFGGKVNSISRYAQRASVPPLLIKSIISIFLNLNRMEVYHGQN